VARLQLWDNMGILYIKDDGQWREPENNGQAGDQRSAPGSGAAMHGNPAPPEEGRELASQPAAHARTSSVAAPEPGAAPKPL